MAARTYVYRIFDGFETVYVGKGSGRRIRQQAARFKCQGEIIQHCTTDEEAWGVSKIDVFRIHEVANGPWC